MISSFDADFQVFINNRLDSVGKAVLNNTDYHSENDNIERQSAQLLAALPHEQALTLQDMDDSYSAIINIYENACYRQGFRDGLRFVTEI